MTQGTQVAKASMGRRAVTALVVAGTVGLAGCSSVPDAVNPVEWYRGASDTVGGWVGDDEPVPAEPGRSAAGDPGTSPDTSYPNLSTVPPRPTPSTTPAEREALRKGLVSDRANARYTEPPESPTETRPEESAPSRSSSDPEPRRSPEPQSSLPQSSAPQPSDLQASAPQSPTPPAAAKPSTAGQAAPPQPETTRPSEPSADRSALWPNRPAPETPGVDASTTGRVGDSPVRASAAPRPSIASEPVRSPVPEPQAPAATGQLADRTIYDSAGSAARAAIPSTAPPPAPPSARAPAPGAASQSVIVNEDAIGGSTPAPSFAGQRYLASTIYFRHGSARLTAAERKAIAEVSRTAATTGAAVQVIGHASSRTADLSLRDHELANFSISMKRAQAVADALIAGSLPADRIRVEALGDAQPEFYEVMPSGEAGNRRVEIVLIY